MTIALSGFMGSGKSTVGRELSRLLGCPAIDLDDFIELTAGRTIPEIFRTEGEEAFRLLELTALRRVLDANGEDNENDAPHLILSLGGGTLTTPECADLVRRRTVCVYLRATTDTLLANLRDNSAGRPMLSQGASLRERIEQLMRERAGIYESVARHIIDIDGKSLDSVAGELSIILRAAQTR